MSLKMKSLRDVLREYSQRANGTILRAIPGGKHPVLGAWWSLEGSLGYGDGASLREAHLKRVQRNAQVDAEKIG